MSAPPELIEVAEAVAKELGLAAPAFCGKGAFKETYRVQGKDRKAIALKLVDRAKIDFARTEREINSLKRCDSPRIAKVLGTHIFKASGRRVFDIVLEEFFDGGSLEDRLKLCPMTKAEVVELCIGLLLAVSDLHPLQLVHRDIKPANVMFRKDSSDPVLVDFGLVRDLSQTSLTATWLPTGPGTPFYASPEQLNNEKAMIDWRSDQFSIGVVAGHLLTNQHPYQTDPANPSSAIHAALERRGPTKEFQQAMNDMGLMAIAKMVSPWPVQRFSEPALALVALKS
jgi:serine/threonine protein kinase